MKSIEKHRKGPKALKPLICEACGGFLGLLGRALTLPWGDAWLLVALFVAHPVHTESVLYIVGRADLLCLLLLLVSTLLYAPCIKDARPAFLRLPLAAALLVAAGLCKETGAAGSLEK